MIGGWSRVGEDHVITRRVTVPKKALKTFELSNSQIARRTLKENRKQGLVAKRAANRAQNAKDLEAAQLRRRAVQAGRAS